jgi:hypothetical protein
MICRSLEFRDNYGHEFVTRRLFLQSMSDEGYKECANFSCNDDHEHHTNCGSPISSYCYAQVFTVGRAGHMSKLSAAQKAVLAPALRNATGDRTTNIFGSFSVYEVPLSAKEPPAIIVISVGVGRDGSQTQLPVDRCDP